MNGEYQSTRGRSPIALDVCRVSESGGGGGSRRRGSASQDQGAPAAGTDLDDPLVDRLLAMAMESARARVVDRKTIVRANGGRPDRPLGVVGEIDGDDETIAAVIDVVSLELWSNGAVIARVRGTVVAEFGGLKRTVRVHAPPKVTQVWPGEMPAGWR